MDTSGAGGAAERVTQAARRADGREWLETLARVGYAASGVLHLIIAWIALQVAFGGGSSSGGSGSADQSGALSTLAQNGFGKVLLGVVLLGFLGLGVWQLIDAFAGDRNELSDRVKAAAKGVVYLVLAWSALSFLRGSGQSSSEQNQGLTAKLLDAPFGRVIVVVIGLVVLGVGAYHVHKGWSEGFLDDLERSPGTWARRAGRVGYCAKGVALGVVGVLFALAGFHGSSKEATGLDGALRTLREAPFGPYVLAVVALGIGAYGVYSFSRAKHAET